MAVNLETNFSRKGGEEMQELKECCYCGKKAHLFSYKFEVFVHVRCVLEAAANNVKDLEARAMLKELLEQI